MIQLLFHKRQTLQKQPLFFTCLLTVPVKTKPSGYAEKTGYNKKYNRRNVITVGKKRPSNC